MIRRATWLFAAGSVLLVLMLAAVAYGWWHMQQDAAHERILTDAVAATAEAQAERDAALLESRRTDSLALLRQQERDTAMAVVMSLQARLARLASQQPAGSFQGVPAGSEPEGISWRDAFFVADSALTQSQAALFAEKARSQLFLEDRDRLKRLANTDSLAIVRLNAGIRAALAVNACHILWVINCPSRKAMLVTGLAAGAITTVIVTHPWTRTGDTLRTARRAGFSIRF